MAVSFDQPGRLRSATHTPLIGVLVGAPVSALLWVAILLLAGLLR